MEDGRRVISSGVCGDGDCRVLSYHSGFSKPTLSAAPDVQPRDLLDDSIRYGNHDRGIVCGTLWRATKSCSENDVERGFTANADRNRFGERGIPANCSVDRSGDFLAIEKAFFQSRRDNDAADPDRPGKVEECQETKFDPHRYSSRIDPKSA